MTVLQGATNISSIVINGKWNAIADSQVKKKRTTIPSALCERRYQCAGHSQTVVRLQLVKGSYIITPCVKVCCSRYAQISFLQSVEDRTAKQEERVTGTASGNRL